MSIPIMLIAASCGLLLSRRRAGWPLLLIGLPLMAGILAAEILDGAAWAQASASAVLGCVVFQIAFVTAGYWAERDEGSDQVGGRTRDASDRFAGQTAPRSPSRPKATT